jgi:hypothetical protein
MPNLDSCKYIIGVPDLWPGTHCIHIHYLCQCQLINLCLSSVLAYLFYSHLLLILAYLTSRTYISLSTHIHIYVSYSIHVYHPHQPIYLYPSFISAHLLMSITHIILFTHILMFIIYISIRDRLRYVPTGSFLGFVKCSA